MEVRDYKIDIHFKVPWYTVTCYKEDLQSFNKESCRNDHDIDRKMLRRDVWSLTQLDAASQDRKKLQGTTNDTETTQRNFVPQEVRDK